MKSATRRKQQQDELRAKILDAARELFVAHGVEAVSMRKVAEKIGYTATTLYNHFEDKDALLRALCEADFGALDESFARIGRISNPIERLRKLGQAYIEFALRYPSHYRFMFMTPHPPRDVEEPCAQAHHGDPDQDAYAFVRATIVEALAAGLFRDDYQDPDLLSQVFWSGVHGVAALHLVMGEDKWVQWRPVEEVALTAIELIIAGLVRNGSGTRGTAHPTGARARKSRSVSSEE
jgi:AcrR family transcriptional regulator